MTDLSEPNPELLLQPGNVIHLTDVSELAEFEDIVAGVIDPNLDTEKWIARVPLKEMIRPRYKPPVRGAKPQTFNGNIRNLAIDVLEDPYERLVSASEEGWQPRRGGGNFVLSSEHKDALIPLYKGFILTGDAHSSGYGMVGQIQVGLWYYPFSYTVDRAGTSVTHHLTKKDGTAYDYTYTRNVDSVRSSGKSNGEAIRRVVTQPKLEPEKFIAHDAASRAVGFALLRDAMMRPISAPMRD